jgi:hypothetical protein
MCAFGRIDVRAWPHCQSGTGAYHLPERGKRVQELTKETTMKTAIMKVVAAIGLATMLTLAGVSVLAQSNPNLDCQPRQGIDYC